MRKKFYKITYVILSIVMLFTLVSCNEKENNNHIQSISSYPEINISGELKTAVTDDKLLSSFSKVYTYGNDQIESYLFWCELEITDVHILKTAQSNENWLTDGIHLFDAPIIKQGEVLNYKQMVPEGAPAEAIVYTAGNKKYAYSISYNGRDGGVSLIEIENMIIDAAEFKSVITMDEHEPEEETTTSSQLPSTEMMIEVYWVNEDLNVFVKEVTIKSESKWHVWKALKLSNSYIPRDCSLLSFELIKEKNGVLELNFSQSFMEIKNSDAEHLLLQSIANTFIEAYDFSAIRFKVEGEYYQSNNCEPATEFEYINC